MRVGRGGQQPDLARGEALRRGEGRGVGGGRGERRCGACREASGSVRRAASARAGGRWGTRGQ